MKPQAIYNGCFKNITRRDFIRLTSLMAGGLLTGCAVNPVTGRQQLMLVSEEQEIEMDRRNSPHQFSSDYGAMQDRVLNAYISDVGLKLASRTHRPRMPYSFRAVNAVYANAYAFPGGSIACTRGILFAIESEAELAGLLGHELGHVNARHTAEQMSKGLLVQAFVGGLSALAGTQGTGYGRLAAQLGMIGAGALLASYSRDNEREADALGMEYMVRAGYSPKGMISLMETLQRMSDREPSIIELMFATHPMSRERYRTALNRAHTRYGGAMHLPLYRERYMDHTTALRAMRRAVQEMQKGEREIMQERFGLAENHFRKALRLAPNDYAGLLLMSISLMLQEKFKQALRYALKARQVYPGEAKSYHLSGYVKIRLHDYEGAYRDFTDYDRILPGNPNITFFRGYAQEKMHHIKAAARAYHRYLQMVREGEKARYAYMRLKEWGYYK